MTTADCPTDFQSSVVIDKLDNSSCLTPDKVSDTVTNTLKKSVTSNMADEINLTDSINLSDSKILTDSKNSEFLGTNETENSRKDQESPSDQDLNSETVAKSSNDEWLDIMGSGDFKKKVIKPGLGEDTRPNRGDRVVINVSYYVNSFLFEEKKDLCFIVGDLDVIQGLDLVVCLMEKGELAKVIIPSKLAYGTAGLSPNVPPDSEIVCEIELKEVEVIDEDSLSVSERLKLGDEKRSRGNFFYDRAQYIDAIHCYEKSAEYLDGVRDCSDSSPEELQEIVNMRLKVYNNMAASHLKLSAYSAALKSVDAVLKVQPRNVKALFRKGKILGTQGSTDEAIACMKIAANLEPETKVIQTELIKLRSRKKKEEQNQKAMYQRMFKSETKKSSESVSKFRKWSMISCGVLAVAIGSAVAYRQLHT